MKKYYLSVLLMMAAGLQAMWAQKLLIYKTDNQIKEYEVSELDSIVFVDAPRIQICPDNNHPHVIDLDLSSGTKWCCCNVGASAPEEYGGYFAWGETTTQDINSWNTYKYCKGSYDTLTKYCIHSSYGYNGFTDGLTELLPEDDAATVNCGSDWQMPSMDQLEELYNNSCITTEWSTINGVNGLKITSKSNGNCIFLPAAGYRNEANLYDVGSYGSYWSHSIRPLHSYDAYDFVFGLNYFRMDYPGSRFDGQSIRPVCVQDALPAKLVTEIVLCEEQISLHINETKTLTATVFPEEADNKTVIWESSNVDVAMVSSEGLVTAIAEGSCTIICRAVDGSNVYAGCEVMVFPLIDNSGTIDGKEYIDLGLPSGTLWATCNIGAISPEECGERYAWGETIPKDKYDWSTYKYCKGSYNTITKYCSHSYGYNGFTDTLIELLPEDDAATVNWGSKWQMPSKAQMDELINNSYTTTEWTTKNNINGRRITSRINGRSIFLPAAGYCYGTNPEWVGYVGNYWPRSLNTDYSDDAYCFYFHSDYFYWDDGGRCTGRSVRPVRKQ